ncbi:hypothetical protein [Halovenus sp. HT40]|uniref:hypothetical protein n=1 Tax=Halovenus sp. HT40 TaxID=3126691 RepID=UPI00300F3003
MHGHPVQAIDSIIGRTEPLPPTGLDEGWVDRCDGSERPACRPATGGAADRSITAVA